MRLEHVHRARHKGGFRSDGQRDRIERAIGGAVGSRLGAFVKFRSGRVLSLRQTVDAVIEEQNFDANVTAQHVNGMVAADGQRVAIARGYPNFQFRVGDFDSGGYRRCATMDRVEPVGVHVVREAAGATDARDHHEILPANAKLRKDGLHRREDGVIAAAGTPAHFLVGLKVFFREWRKRRGGHRWFPGIPSISSNFCSSSACLNGRP